MTHCTTSFFRQVVPIAARRRTVGSNETRPDGSSGKIAAGILAGLYSACVPGDGFGHFGSVAGERKKKNLVKLRMNYLFC